MEKTLGEFQSDDFLSYIQTKLFMDKDKKTDTFEYLSKKVVHIGNDDIKISNKRFFEKIEKSDMIPFALTFLVKFIFLFFIFDQIFYYVLRSDFEGVEGGITKLYEEIDKERELNNTNYL